jgi:hypothetical protein
MKMLNKSAWIVVVLLGCSSCNRKPESLGKEGENPAVTSSVTSVEPNSNNETQEQPVSPQTTSNQLSAEPWFYVTNSGQRFTVFVTRQNDLVVSSKTVDESGRLKWMDRFSYNTDSTNPIEMLRTKADGRMVRVLFQYKDGKQTKIMIGTDGTQIPPEKQDEYLNE